MKKAVHKTKKITKVKKGTTSPKKYLHPLHKEVHPAITFIVLGSSSFISLTLLFVAISIQASY